jgi:hypothetical protein
MVRFSPSEVWQFKFECCFQAQEISSINALVFLLWRSIFAVLVYWDFCTRGLFLCPALFLWGRFCVLSWFAVCFSILWGSLSLGAATGLGDEFCDPLHALLWGNGLLLTCSQPSCLSSVCLLIVHAQISSLPPLHLSLVHFQHSHPLCCCVRLQFAVTQCFFWGVSLPRDYDGLSQG